MPEILLLEDDPAIAATVVFALQREGFGVCHHLLLSEARTDAAARRPQAAVLDVGLPDGHGMDLCRHAVLWLGLSDVRGVREASATVAGKPRAVKPGTPNGELAQGFHVELPEDWPAAADSAALAAHVELELVEVLGRRRDGITFGGAMALLYGLMYVLLQQGQTALVIGSVGLFAAVMWLTRGVDWYRLFDEALVPTPRTVARPAAAAE